MARPTKFVEFKFCKSCHKELNYKKFRIVKTLTMEKILRFYTKKNNKNNII